LIIRSVTILDSVGYTRLIQLKSPGYEEFDHWSRPADERDRTTTFRIAVAAPELAELFDGSERLMGVHAVRTTLRGDYAA